MINPWIKKNGPLAILAPMEDVTDHVFRSMLKDYGPPDIYFTEFAMVKGIVSGQKNSRNRMEAPRDQSPVIAQIWGNEIEQYRTAIHFLRRAGFHGIDLNMGCPEPSVTNKGCCSALIKRPELARDLIRESIKAAQEPLNNCPPIPVSVKTRIGFDGLPNKLLAEAWFKTLLQEPISALAIHARTRDQMSEGSPFYEYFSYAVEIRNKLGSQALIVGNGDILDKKQGEELARIHNLDGYMIGRGLFTNPWLFSDRDFQGSSIAERLEFAKEHLDRYESFWGERRNFEIIKKFFKIYLQGFYGAKELKDKFMATHSYEDAKLVLTSFN